MTSTGRTRAADPAATSPGPPDDAGPGWVYPTLEPAVARGVEALRRFTGQRFVGRALAAPVIFLAPLIAALALCAGAALGLLLAMKVGILGQRHVGLIARHPQLQVALSWGVLIAEFAAVPAITFLVRRRRSLLAARPPERSP